jgi:hypothetical protein
MDTTTKTGTVVLLDTTVQTEIALGGFGGCS